MFVHNNQVPVTCFHTVCCLCVAGQSAGWMAGMRCSNKQVDTQLALHHKTNLLGP